jgi:hypothetical protein
MMSTSPTALGFNLIFRRPAIAMAEITWRWSVAVAAWFLTIFFLIEYADSLPVRALDRLLLDTQQPVLVLKALRRIFQGSGVRFVDTAVMLAIALTIAWIFVALLGRAATVKALLDEFSIPQSGGPPRHIFLSLLSLNILRAAATLAAVVCAGGVVLIASSVWASTKVSVSDAGRLSLAALLITWIAWGMLNWFLSTAGIYAVSKSESALHAVGSTVRDFQEKTSAFLAASTWFGFAHLGAFITASGAGFFVLGAAGTLPFAVVLFLEILIAAVYCAVADALYTGRVAAYVAIIFSDALPKETGFSSPVVPSSVDRSELILSDVPFPAS